MADGLDDGGHRGDPKWQPGDITALLGNPFYAINIHPVLAEPHEPIFTEDEWVEVNVRLVDDLGAETYLRNLLMVLRGETLIG
jgi:hypothetical protein